MLRVLGNFLKVTNFEYADLHAITAEVKMLLTNPAPNKFSPWQADKTEFTTLASPQLKYLPYLLSKLAEHNIAARIC